MYWKKYSFLSLLKTFIKLSYNRFALTQRDGNSKFDENSRKLPKRIENTFQKTLTADTYNQGLFGKGLINA